MRPTTLRRRGPQHPQMTAPTDFHTLPDRLDGGARHRGLANGVRQGFEVVSRRFLAWSERQPHDVPPAGCCQSVGVRGTQVVAVRFDVGRERAEHGGGVPVDVGKGAHGIPLTSRPRAAARTQRPTSLMARCARPVLDSAPPSSRTRVQRNAGRVVRSQRLTVSVCRAVTPLPRALHAIRVLAGVHLTRIPTISRRPLR